MGTLSFYIRACESLTKNLNQMNFHKCHIRHLNKLPETDRQSKEEHQLCRKNSIAPTNL